MHFPIKGTEVFNDIPQHTHSSEQDLQVPSTSLYQSLQVQVPIDVTWALESQASLELISLVQGDQVTSEEQQ